MLKAREILILKHEVGLSLREIGQACNCGKSTVAEILSRVEKAGIKWPIDLSDKQLMSRIYPPLESKSSPPEPDLEYIFCEMKKKNVTLMLLWEEYKRIILTELCTLNSVKDTVISKQITKYQCTRSIKLAKKLRLTGLEILCHMSILIPVS